MYGMNGGRERWRAAFTAAPLVASALCLSACAGAPPATATWQDAAEFLKHGRKTVLDGRLTEGAAISDSSPVCVDLAPAYRAYYGSVSVSCDGNGYDFLSRRGERLAVYSLFVTLDDEAEARLANVNYVGPGYSLRKTGETHLVLAGEPAFCGTFTALVVRPRRGVSYVLLISGRPHGGTAAAPTFSCDPSAAGER